MRLLWYNIWYNIVPHDNLFILLYIVFLHSVLLPYFHHTLMSSKREVFMGHWSPMNVTVIISQENKWSLCVHRLLSGYLILLHSSAHSKVQNMYILCVSYVMLLAAHNAVNCGTPTALPINGSVYYTSTTEGSTAFVECNEDLELQGHITPFILICSAKGSWIPNITNPICTQILTTGT